MNDGHPTFIHDNYTEYVLSDIAQTAKGTRVTRHLKAEGWRGLTVGRTT